MSFPNIFRKSSSSSERILSLDIHSHLLPGIDDGAKTLDESIQLIRSFELLGYKRLITTPHILQDYYPNTPEIINKKLEELKAELVKQEIDMSISAAAEYYLDEFLMEKVNNKEELLSFGPNYVLFEMSFMAESPYLKDFIFLLKSAGYNPVLAHVERYSYYNRDMDAIIDLVERGCLIQININSLVGYYGKPALQTAHKLIDKGYVHLLGSDCHNAQHIEILKKAQKSKYYAKALNLPLINYSTDI